MIRNEGALRAQAIAFIRDEYRSRTPDGYASSFFRDTTLDIEGAVFSKGTNAHVVIRCTDSPLNWLFNFLFIKVLVFARRTFAYGNKESKIRLHLGFYLDYLSYARGFLHAWFQSHPEIEYVTFSGHSLGGAIVTLAAVDIQKNFEQHFAGDRITCVTFGAPAVGNKAFVESYNRRVPYTFRFKYRGDVVSESPPEVLGFSKVAETIQLGKPRKFPWFHLKDHELVNYELGTPYP